MTEGEWDRCPDPGPMLEEIRSFAAGHYVAFYRLSKAEGVEVIRVVHAARDVQLL